MSVSAVTSRLGSPRVFVNAWAQGLHIPGCAGASETLHLPLFFPKNPIKGYLFRESTLRLLLDQPQGPLVGYEICNGRVVTEGLTDTKIPVSGPHHESLGDAWQSYMKEHPAHFPVGGFVKLVDAQAVFQAEHQPLWMDTIIHSALVAIDRYRIRHVPDVATTGYDWAGDLARRFREIAVFVGAILFIRDDAQEALQVSPPDGIVLGPVYHPSVVSQVVDFFRLLGEVEAYLVRGFMPQAVLLQWHTPNSGHVQRVDAMSGSLALARVHHDGWWQSTRNCLVPACGREGSFDRVHAVDMAQWPVRCVFVGDHATVLEEMARSGEGQASTPYEQLWERGVMDALVRLQGNYLLAHYNIAPDVIAGLLEEFNSQVFAGLQGAEVTLHCDAFNRWSRQLAAVLEEHGATPDDAVDLMPMLRTALLNMQVIRVNGSTSHPHS